MEKKRCSGEQVVLHRGDCWLHSDPVSHHCRWQLVLPALLPAWANPQLFNCQVITTYMVKTLQTTSLIGVDHPHAQQLMRNACTLHHQAKFDRGCPPAEWLESWKNQLIEFVIFCWVFLDVVWMSRLPKNDYL